LIDLLSNSLPIGFQLGRRKKLCDGSVLGNSAIADRLSPVLCRVDFDRLRCKTGILQKIASSGSSDCITLLDTSRSLARNGVRGDRSANSNRYRPHFLQADFWPGTTSGLPVI